MPSANRVPKASCRLVSDDREDTDDAKECIHHTGGPGVGAEVHPTSGGTEIHAGMHPTYETERVPRRVDGLSKGTAIG